MPFPRSGEISFDDYLLETGAPKGRPVNLDSIRSSLGGQRNASSEQSSVDGLDPNAPIPKTGEVGLSNFHGSVLGHDFTFTPSISGSLNIDFSGLVNPGTNNAPFIVLMYKRTDTGMLVRIGGGYDWGSLNFEEFTIATSPAYDLKLKVQGESFGSRFSYDNKTSTIQARENFQYMVRVSLPRGGSAETFEQLNFNLIIENAHDESISTVVPVDLKIDYAPEVLGYDPECIPALKNEMETYNFNFTGKSTHLLRTEYGFKHDGLTPTGDTPRITFRRRYDGSRTLVEVRRPGYNFKEAMVMSGNQPVHFIYDKQTSVNHTENFTGAGSPLTVHELTGSDEVSFSYSVGSSTTNEVSEVSVGIFIGPMDSTPDCINYHFKLSKDYTAPEEVQQPVLFERIERTHNVVNTNTGETIFEEIRLKSNGTRLQLEHKGETSDICEIDSRLEYSFEISNETEFGATKETGDSGFVPQNDVTSRNFRVVDSSVDETITLQCPLSSETSLEVFVIAREISRPQYFEKTILRYTLNNQAESPVTLSERIFEDVLTRVGPGEYSEQKIVGPTPENVLNSQVLELTITRDNWMTTASVGQNTTVIDDTGVDLSFTLSDMSSGIQVRNINTNKILENGESFSIFIEKTPMDSEGRAVARHSDTESFKLLIEQPSYGVTQLYTMALQFDFSSLVDELVFNVSGGDTSYQLQTEQSYGLDYPTLGGVSLQRRTDGSWFMGMEGFENAKYELKKLQKIASGTGTLQYRIVPSSGTVEQFSGVEWAKWYDAHPETEEGFYTVPSKQPIADDGLLGQTLNGVYNPNILPILGSGLYAGNPSDRHNYVVLAEDNKPTRTVFKVQFRDKFSGIFFTEKDVIVHYNIS